jgi:glycolate oxidase FAD binding subunit
MDTALRTLQERVRAAAVQRSPLAIRAGGSKDFYGNAASGEVFDPREYSGIIDYEPTELVVTVRSGTRLAELEKTLAAERQMLPFEPPHFGAAATVGGAVASGLSGPRRAAAGAVRDFVLGASLLDGRAQVLSFGGRVMKNVAGYDASRMLAGSLGTLGLILDVSLKLLPVPVAEQTLHFDVDETDAIRLVNEWGGQPLPISATAWVDGRLAVRLSGAAAGVRAAVAKLGGAAVEGAALWTELREHTHVFFQPDGEATLWRLAVPPTTPPLGLGPTQSSGAAASAGYGRLRRQPRCGNAPRRSAATRRASAAATALRRSSRSHRQIAAIHRRLKTEFDPAGIFNPGRLYAEL